MAKNPKEQVRSVKTAADDRPFIPQKFQHPAAIIFLFICLLVFFHSIVFDGKTYQGVDTIAAHSWETLLKDAKADGIYPLWNPYIFCGMPGYASMTFAVLPDWNDAVISIWWVVKYVSGFLFFQREDGASLFLYLVFGIGVYLIAYRLFKNKPVALLVALMTTYTTDVTQYIMLGHSTKIAVLAWFPYAFLLVEKLREKFNLIYAFLLAVVVRLMIEPGHVQFIYYIYLALGFYLLFFFIRALIKKENWKGIFISGATLVITTAFAFLMGADLHFSTLEYNPYSMRGSNAIANTSLVSQSKTVEGGLDYDYATNWSFSPGEMMTFLIPSWYGFGWHTYQGPLTQNREARLNTYWGPQPQPVDNPHYMGIIVIVLAIIGFVKNRKQSFVQYMGISILFSLLVAFGKEFSLIYDLLYWYLPMFNKFRIPLMILMLVQFFTPFLAGYGILSLATESKKMSQPQERQWKYSLGFLALCFIMTFIGKGVLKDIYSSFFPIQEVGQVLAPYFGQDRGVLAIVHDIVFSSVVTDILVGCVLLIVTFGAFYYYQKGKLKSTILYGILIIAILFDLWRVASKPSEPRPKQESIKVMAKPEYIKILEQDTTSYRVLKVQDGQPVYDNTFAYWRISNAYGYHGAKMRIFQDMVDVAGMGNPLVWQLMNIKYLISNRNEASPALIEMYNSPSTKIYGFRFALPRVFFVNKYEVSDNLGMLKKMAEHAFNPLDVAYVSEDIKTKIDPPLQGASAEIEHYGIQDLKIRANASGNNLLFLSEAFYPKGWKAFIDGKETEILRLNYMFRGVIVPQGVHSVEMKFEPESFASGRKISLAANIIVLAGIVISGGIGWYRKRARLQNKSGDTTEA
ncbi:MAG: YfhO family protein [Bacteroidetes bacterium]|nr:YfhO family protein [Bacteroidota bacterium]